MTDAERFNMTHVAAGSSTGGQFGSAGGGAKPTGGHTGAHPAAQHTAPAGPPHHTLSYDPKTNKGAGYGMPHGDPNVKQLQTALNKLGLSDSHGKPLRIDGQLGPLTTSSIKALQTRLGVKADGHVTPAFFAQVVALKALPHRSADPAVRGVQTLHEGATERLHQYWVHGEGAAKIAWGAPGDFDRCVSHLSKFIGDAKGYCNLAHHAALGYYPATHAKMDGHRSEDGIHMPTKEDLQVGAPLPFVRSFALSDISIRAGGDGRTVDAYATVFDTPTPIHDQDGDYIEVIDRKAFDRILQKVAPAGGRSSWRVGVFYNHGMTLHGTPSDLHSVPIGIPLEIKADGNGLFTRTRYSKGEDVDRILDRISEGSLSAYSFSGRFDRSDPMPMRGGFRADRRGNLPTVRRTESTLREYGPTPFPAYETASIVGIRAEQITEQLDRITELLRSGGTLPAFDPGDLPPLSGAPEHRDSPPEDSHTVRSGRSVKEELAAQRARFIQKYGSQVDA